MLYDADGERVRRTVDGATVWYLGSGLEIDAAGTEKISLGAGTYSDGELWAHASDHLGTATYTVSWETSQETYRRYTPFGTPRSSATDNAVGASDLTFTGQRDDGATNLMYYGARYYDPALGQFSQADRVTPNPLNGADWNRFAYVRNNPIAFTDPTGNEPRIGLGMAGCTRSVVRSVQRDYSRPVAATRQVVRARTVTKRTQSIQRIVSVNTGAGAPGGSYASPPSPVQPPEPVRPAPVSSPTTNTTDKPQLTIVDVHKVVWAKTRNDVPQLPLETQVDYLVNEAAIGAGATGCPLVVCTGAAVDTEGVTISGGPSVAVAFGAWPTLRQNPDRPKGWSSGENNQVFGWLGPLGAEYTFDESMEDGEWTGTAYLGGADLYKVPKVKAGAGGGYAHWWFLEYRWPWRD